MKKKFLTHCLLALWALMLSLASCDSTGVGTEQGDYVVAIEVDSLREFVTLVAQLSEKKFNEVLHSSLIFYIFVRKCTYINKTEGHVYSICEH